MPRSMTRRPRGFRAISMTSTKGSEPMTISPRTKTLIDRLPDHPLSPSMRDAMIAAAAASEGFSGHKIALQSDQRMTEVGRREALREALTQNYGKQWARAKAPIAKARSEIAARRA